MKKLTLLFAAVALLAPAGVAEATHKPNQYCSQTGDICMSTEKVDGKRILRIGLIERYFDRYRLCVIAPNDSRECHNYRIERQGRAYGDNVNWRNNFSYHRRGSYTVIWKSLPDNSQVGRRLGFHV